MQNSPCFEMLEIHDKISFYLKNLIHISQLTRQPWYYRAREYCGINLYSFPNLMYSPEQAKREN